MDPPPKYSAKRRRLNTQGAEDNEEAQATRTGQPAIDMQSKFGLFTMQRP